MMLQYRHSTTHVECILMYPLLQRTRAMRNTRYRKTIASMKAQYTEASLVGLHEVGVFVTL
ncbi:MAG: hypothetical protein NVS4B11_00640 [Ktedonobacteraceae bacterium]